MHCLASPVRSHGSCFVRHYNTGASTCTLSFAGWSRTVRTRAADLHNGNHQPLFLSPDTPAILDSKVLLAAGILRTVYNNREEELNTQEPDLKTNWRSELDIDDVLEKARFAELELYPPATVEQLMEAADCFSLLLGEDELTPEAATETALNE